MSKRLIYEEDAIDALKQLRKNISGDYTELDPLVMAGCGYIGDCIGEIECLPSAQPGDIARDIATIIENEKDMRVILQQRWISVSEDTPKKRDWYLGIFKEPDTGWINPLPFICDYVGKETKATTKEGWILRGFTDREEYIDYYFNLECVAWMPLPEAYKG